MPNQKRHVLAAFDAETGHLLYRTEAEGWTENVDKALGFGCRSEANAYLREYNQVEHRVPFQLVCVPVYGCIKPTVGASRVEEVVELPLSTAGICG